MKEPVLTSKIMLRPVVPQGVPFPHIQTLFFQLMQFKDVADQLAIYRMVLAGSVLGLMRGATAQHTLPSFKVACYSRSMSFSSKQGGQSPYPKKGKQHPQKDR